jgi:hypothetical protein
VEQHREAGEAGDSANAADDDGHHLLEAVADAEELEHRHRGQQADAMAEQDTDDPHMEQDRTPDELPAAQELARLGAPAVLIGVEPHQAANEEHRQRDVGIDRESGGMDETLHDQAPAPVSSATRWRVFLPA